MDFLDLAVSAIAVLLMLNLIGKVAEKFRFLIPERNVVETITITGSLPAVNLEEIAAKPFLFHNAAAYQTGNKQIWILQLSLGGEPVIAWTDSANVGWKLFQQKKGKGLMYLQGDILDMESK